MSSTLTMKLLTKCIYLITTNNCYEIITRVEPVTKLPGGLTQLIKDFYEGHVKI
jgi:hypothetical protein